jgi:hypothetical protein
MLETFNVFLQQQGGVNILGKVFDFHMAYRHGDGSEEQWMNVVASMV